MSAIVDAAAREAALDPTRSFIVQAPAGSGKTGLLIQRVLRLLATVERPEEILAITFTRKAAAEMRRRVLQALQQAGETEPLAENERVTWQLARAALARDQQQGWELQQNVTRLRIQTIDSLCASLGRQMPVISGLGAPPAIVEKPRELYREAAERTLAHIDANDAHGEALRCMLRHLDGNWGAARGLIEAMLGRREQWLRRVGSFRADSGARTALEEAFRQERLRILKRLAGLMPAEEEALVARMARYAAGHLTAVASDSPIAALLDMTSYPEVEEAATSRWQGLATLLLKKEGEWRLGVDKNSGFPPGKGEQAEFKQQMKELLGRLSERDGLCEALHAVRCMPPAAFSDAQWEALGAIVAVLPYAAAQLQLLFGERGEIDFPGLAQAAIRALGEPDAPTDLLLAMDVRLCHLLVDEFQDTSRGQWELLERLTAGWSEGDGRTAFLVGDPMQSIYRFREADVALFLRAWREGLPEVPLAPLRLQTNFRSAGGIVAWVNRWFAEILGDAEDAESGRVPYAASNAHHVATAGAVQWHAFVGDDEREARSREALAVVDAIRAARGGDPDGSIAVLVRNRSHLDRIVPALRDAGIGFRAVDIEPLAARPVVQDLLAITRALSHLADRVAWMSLLRAPWCGFTLAELHQFSAGREIWEQLQDEELLARLDADSSLRARHLRESLRPLVEGRLRGSLRECVERAWLGLGGPAVARSESELDDAEAFFDQLDALEEAGELPDATRLEDHLAELHAAPESTDALVQLMTIHKSKGLEFGTVIVPGLDRKPRAADRPLFAWKAHADGSLMMAPVRATGESEEPAFDYLRALEDTACEHEVERLLYVAVTRAEHRLHLLGFARLDKEGKVKRPSSRCLLGKAWCAAKDAFGAAAPLPAAVARDDVAEAPQQVAQMSAAVLEVRVPDLAHIAAPPLAEEAVAIEFSWVGETAREVGKVTHRWLQRIGTEGVSHWSEARVTALRPAILRELARRGVPPGERDGAATRVVRALGGAVTDPRGRWVLASRPDARCEYRIRVAGPGGVRLAIIDRMFTDEEGQRWIVDYKTSAHEGGSLEAFLDSELERYGAQLTRYRNAFPAVAVSLGLYFPLVRGWRELRAGMPKALSLA